MVHQIREAEARDIPLLASIEDAADQLFLDAFGDVTWEPATARDVHVPWPGFLLVAGDPVVGFAHVLILDGHAHLEQLSVHPDHMGHGVGSALLEAVCERARAAGHQEITLCTYADLRWNGPFYASRGFERLGPDGEWPTEPAYLLLLQEAERRTRLDEHGRRIVMIRHLTG